MTSLRRRQRRLTGHYARVDGIPFTMPVNSQHSPALMAAFPIDGDAAAALLPGEELHPLRLPNQRALLALTVVNYQTTDIGSYIEFSIAIPCTHGPRPARPVTPLLLPRVHGTGQYVLDLPVSTEISVKGGKGIWGMPKHQANLSFKVTPDTVSSRYEINGQLGVGISITRPTGPALPGRMRAVNYCSFRGMLFKSVIAFASPIHVAFGRRADAHLTLGPSPRTAQLRGLNIAERPLFVAYLPDTHGLLDDHTESWFLTSPDSFPCTTEGLETVATLGMSQARLPAPTTAASTTPTMEVSR